MPWPEYNEVVSTFFDLVREQGCWLDYDYDPVETAKLFANETTVKHATIPEIRRMLTYIVRGERFCDGFWEGMIEEGHVRRLLERLAEIEREGLAARRIGCDFETDERCRRNADRRGGAGARQGISLDMPPSPTN